MCMCTFGYKILKLSVDGWNDFKIEMISKLYSYKKLTFKLQYVVPKTDFFFDTTFFELAKRWSAYQPAITR